MSLLQVPTIPQLLLTDASDSGSDGEDDNEFQIDSDIIANHTQENVETAKKVDTSSVYTSIHVIIYFLNSNRVLKKNNPFEQEESVVIAIYWSTVK